MYVASSLALLQEEIAAACGRAGRRPDEITLVAVSKTFPASAIREAHAAGVRHVGENRVQEILAKKPELEDLGITWHMIGSLQTNKVKLLLPHLGLLHSLDRLSLAEELSRRASGSSVAALIQVNTTGESTKSGVAPQDLPSLVEAVLALPRIDLKGLMTIGPLQGERDEIRRSFALLRRLRDGVRRDHPSLAVPILSMGMSDDFEIAIEEGATHLRIGSRIFGHRG